MFKRGPEGMSRLCVVGSWHLATGHRSACLAEKGSHRARRARRRGGHRVSLAAACRPSSSPTWRLPSRSAASAPGGSPGHDGLRRGPASGIGIVFLSIDTPIHPDGHRPGADQARACARWRRRLQASPTCWSSRARSRWERVGEAAGHWPASSASIGLRRGVQPRVPAPGRRDGPPAPARTASILGAPTTRRWPRRSPRSTGPSRARS